MTKISPKTKEELQRIIEATLQEKGNAADLNFIDVSHITDMSYMFSKSAFTGDISNWDVGNVTDMSYMFSKSAFTGDISKWDVSNVTDMSEMFDNCPIPDSHKPHFSQKS